MPEGPEVWILSQAINLYDSKFKTCAYGKHLIIEDKLENDNIYLDWSFGLTGEVRINDNNILVKHNVGTVYGHNNMSRSKNELLDGLGVCWVHASDEELNRVIAKWNNSKRVLGALLLDQSLIAGIGVAWGSEILHRIGLKPDVKACEQDLSGLVSAMISVRDEITKFYFDELSKANDVKNFIHSWFKNMYCIRIMKVYKKGTSIKVSGRIWWI
jgi:formamidopyrimidine-DNA glycosylase